MALSSEGEKWRLDEPRMSVGEGPRFYFR
jgi:hypothetical protein